VACKIFLIAFCDVPGNVVRTRCIYHACGCTCAGVLTLGTYIRGGGLV
jgi:hypothetical protein